MHHLGFGGIEIAVRKVGAQHHQRVGVAHRVVARREADQPRHADVIGVVPLDMLLAAQRVHHRRAQGIGQSHHLIMGARAATAAQQRDRLGGIQQLDDAVDIRRRRHHAGRRCGRPTDFGMGGRWLQRHVAGQHDHRNAALADGGADSRFQHARQLFGVAHQLHVMAAFAKQLLRVRLLEVAQPDLGRWNMCRNRQHRHMVAVAIKKPVDQMQVTRAATARADGQLPRGSRLGARGKRGHFLVPHRHPGNAAQAAQAVAQAIQTVAGHAPDALHADVVQGVGDQVGDGGLGHVFDP